MHLKKSERQVLHQKLSKAKSFEDLDDFVGGNWNGAEEMRAIEESIAKRVNGDLYALDPPPPKDVQEAMEKELVEGAEDVVANGQLLAKSVVGKALSESDSVSGQTTPTDSKNPEPVTTNAPLMPSAREQLTKPALISGEDIPTPSPTPAPEKAFCGA